MIRSLGVLVLVASLAACGGDGGPAPGAQASGWAWEGTDAVTADDVRVPGAGFDEAPVGEAISAATTKALEDEPVDPALTTLDPCTLITPAEFATWAGEDVEPKAMPLEDGEACGFINAADDLRLAVGLITLPDARSERFVPPGVGGTTLSPDEQIPAERLRWIVNYPVEHSNILVAEAATYDLVLEVSSLGGRSEAELLSGALGLARSASARIPEGGKK